MKLDKKIPDFGSSLFVTLVYVAFFASGASCLFAEVTWNRMLIVVVGNSMSATAMIIVVFMGGLGLGSYVAGKVIGTRRPTLVPYLLMELAVGVCILASPWLFEVLSRIFSALAESVSDRAGLTLVRIMVSMAALLMPAFLMGATFPAMISGAAPESPEKRTARIGFLYSTNTLGAAAGCFVAGYHLLFEFGVQTTLICAFCLNVAAALSAFAANVLRKPTSHETLAASHSQASGPVGTGAPRRFLNVATFAIGFVALAYEVLLTRVGILYLGNIAAVFALVLTGFLLGTGISAVLGTWMYGVLRRHSSMGDRFFGFLALASGFLLVATPYFLLTTGGEARVTSVGKLLHILLLMTGPTILIGALLPVAIRMLRPEERGEATSESATLYALNTAGGLLGAGLVNHFFVPTLGLQGVLIWLASICAAVGIINLLSPGKSLPRWSVAILCVLIVAVGLKICLPDIVALYATNIAKRTRARSVDILLVREGRAANVTVLDQSDPYLGGSYRDMYLNGVEEASTRYWHTQLFKLLGALPVMVHKSDKPKDVLVIAFGAGITAGSVLASEQVASLDVVDLNPDIEGINNLFTNVNGDVFHQPRFHFHNDDGRNYLVTSGRRYDLIISDSTHPRAYDSWILYTQEFYRDVKKRLLPGGIFAQWVPVDQSMRGELFRIHLNTFRSVFPNSSFWYVYGSDQAFLMATPEPFTLDSQRLQRKLDQLPEWFRAHYYQIDTVARISGFFWLDEFKMSQLIGGETRVNTDDLHYLGKQSALWPLPPQQQLPYFQASVLPYITNLDEKMLAAVRDEQYVAQLVAKYGFFLVQRDLLTAYCLMPQNGDVRYWMSLEFPEGTANVKCN